MNKDYLLQMKLYFESFYAGEITRPCDEDCPDQCDGAHTYELSTEIPPLFENVNG